MKRNVPSLYTGTAIVSCIFLSITSQAQRNCGSMDYLEQQIAADPQRAARLEQIDQFTAQWVSEHGTEDRAVVTIPVVFHVVYRTSAENISDAKILAQLQQLNDDFARLNSDAGSTPSTFTGVAANTEIQFCLAQRDPNGAATTGIVRKQTTSTSFSDNDNVKRNANGGSDAWPRASYLNIWSCNLGSGLLGYAQFPGGTASTDGVVVLYSSVGSLTNPGTASPYNYGRTATHEVGHWLNLRHIWGDATCGNDQVADTPVHNTSNGGCPSHPHYSTCSGQPAEMFMNYMDYTDDGCMNIFTQGQKARMQAIFASGGSRSSITTSLGCTAPSGGGTTCATPSGLGASGITTSAATISWGAVNGATGYTLQYKLNSASTWTSVSVSGTSYGLSGLTSSTAYDAQVRTTCSGGTSAYSGAISFTTTGTGGGCTDTYESNNSSSAAKTIAVNTDIQALIGSAGDNDWYKFNNTSTQRRIKVNLGNLAGDYDVRLYRGTSTQVGISQNGGTTAEQIIYNTTTVATYYIRVYGYNNAYSASQCYTLRASISASNFREGEFDADGIEPVSVGTGLQNLYPNPTTGKLMLDYLSDTGAPVQLLVFDNAGRQVLSVQQTVAEGPSTLVLPLPELANGMYLLRIVDGERTHQQRFMVER